MQVANDYEKEVFNGDVGTVETIDADASELTVRYPSGEAGGFGGREVTYGWAELDNLVYTGITRGKQLVVLVGQKKGLAMAVKNHLGRRRYPKLEEWLS